MRAVLVLANYSHWSLETIEAMPLTYFMEWYDLIPKEENATN